MIIQSLLSQAYLQQSLFLKVYLNFLGWNLNLFAVVEAAELDQLYCYICFVLQFNQPQDFYLSEQTDFAIVIALEIIIA